MFLYLFNCLVIVLEFYVLIIQITYSYVEAIFRKVFPKKRKSVKGKV
jgi:hypothetical protein